MSLETRNKIKAKKPKFIRADASKSASKKFGKRWTQPRGMHHKVRLEKKGHPRMPSPGFGSPKDAYGLTRDGYKLVKVSNINDLSGINTKNEAILLDSNLGKRKKIEILERVAKSGVKVFNVKDVNTYLEKLKKEFEERKKAKKKVAKPSTEVKKESETKPSAVETEEKKIEKAKPKKTKEQKK